MKVNDIADDDDDDDDDVDTDFKSYFDPRAPGSFGGVSALQRLLQGRKSKSEVVTWLRDQPVYTQHFPIRRKFPTNRTVVHALDEQFQADLADVSSLSESNDGVKFILTCIDILSRYAWAIPMRNKSAKSVKAAFELIFAERVPAQLQTDQGKEFENAECQAYFRSLKIKHFNALSSDVHCAVVERFNRTFQSNVKN